MNKFEKLDREKKVLEIIVQSYIYMGMPVSSRHVSRRLNLSSATIRSIMADLEEAGLISHPHTSAGRVPTVKGYRYYVDTLMHLKRIAEHQVKEIELEYQSKVKSLDDILEKTARVLSSFTNCAGIAFLPDTDKEHLRYINLVPLAGKRVLVLLVASSGLVKNYIIELEHSWDKTLLESVSALLSTEFYNMTLDEIKDHLVERLKIERDSSRVLVGTAYEVVRAALMKEIKENLYYDGTSNILRQPEFSTKGKPGEILRFFEEKAMISGLMQEDLLEDELKVHIGTENKTYGLDEFSIVTAGFKTMGQCTGRLGIIGPIRMDYDRVVPLLSGTVTRVLS